MKHLKKLFVLIFISLISLTLAGCKKRLTGDLQYFTIENVQEGGVLKEGTTFSFQLNKEKLPKDKVLVKVIYNNKTLDNPYEKITERVHRNCKLTVVFRDLYKYDIKMNDIDREAITLSPKKDRYLENETVTGTIDLTKVPEGKKVIGVNINQKSVTSFNIETNTFTFVCSEEIASDQVINIALVYQNVKVYKLEFSGISSELRNLIDLKDKYSEGSEIIVNSETFKNFKSKAVRVKRVSYKDRVLDLNVDNKITFNENVKLEIETEPIPTYTITSLGNGRDSLVKNPDKPVYYEGDEVELTFDLTKLIYHHHMKEVKVNDEAIDFTKPYKFKIMKNTKVEITSEEDPKHLVEVDDSQNILNITNLPSDHLVYEGTKITLRVNEGNVPIHHSVKVTVDGNTLSFTNPQEEVTIVKPTKIKVELIEDEKKTLTLTETGGSYITLTPNDGTVYIGENVQAELKTAELKNDNKRVKSAKLNGEDVTFPLNVKLSENVTLEVVYEELPKYEVTKPSDVDIYLNDVITTETSFYEGTVLKFKYNKPVQPTEIALLKVNGEGYEEGTPYTLNKNITVTVEVVDDETKIQSIAITVGSKTEVSPLNANGKYLVGSKITFKAIKYHKLTEIIINGEKIEITGNTEEYQVTVTKTVTTIEVKDETVIEYKRKLNLTLAEGVKVVDPKPDNVYSIGEQLKLQIINTNLKDFELETVELDGVSQTITNSTFHMITVTNSLTNVVATSKVVRVLVKVNLDGNVNSTLTTNEEKVNVGSIITFSAKDFYKIDKVIAKDFSGNETTVNVNYPVYGYTVTESTRELTVVTLKTHTDFIGDNTKYTFVSDKPVYKGKYEIGSTITITPVSHHKFTYVNYNQTTVAIESDGTAKFTLLDGKTLEVGITRTHYHVTLVNGENVTASPSDLWVLNGEKITLTANEHYTIRNVKISGTLVAVYDNTFETVVTSDFELEVVTDMTECQINIIKPSEVDHMISSTPDSNGYYKAGTVVSFKAHDGKAFKKVKIDGILKEYSEAECIQELKFYACYDFTNSLEIIDEYHLVTKVETVLRKPLKLNDIIFNGEVYEDFNLASNITLEEAEVVTAKAPGSSTPEKLVWFKKVGIYHVQAVKANGEHVLYEINVKFEVDGIDLLYNKFSHMDSFKVKNEVREVGFKNVYEPNVVAKTSKLRLDAGELIEEETYVPSDSLSYNYEATDKDTGLAVDFETLAHGLQFKSDTLNKIVQLKIKYAGYQITEEFKVADGFNAYTDNGLRELFEDLSVEKILLQRDIYPELKDYQKDIWVDNSNQVHVSLVNGGPNNAGSFYKRILSGNDPNQKYVDLNGNYYMINAKNIPLVKPADYANINGEYFSSVVNDIFNGLFLFLVNGVLTYDGKHRIRNLQTVGNTNLPELHGGQMNMVAKGSGGLHGIRCSVADFEVQNSNMSYFVIGSFARASSVIINNSRFNINWGSSVFYSNLYYHSPEFTTTTYKKLELTNSELGSSGGPGLFVLDWDKRVRTKLNDDWAHDTDPNSTVLDATPEDPKGLTPYEFNRDPYVKVENTHIRNYMKGDSSWFTSIGINVNALLGPVDSTLGAIKHPALHPKSKTIYFDEHGNKATQLNHKYFNFMAYFQNNYINDFQDNNFNKPYTGVHDTPQFDINWKYPEALQWIRNYHKSNYLNEDPVFNAFAKAAGGTFTPFGFDIVQKFREKFNLNPSLDPNNIQMIFASCIIEGYLTHKVILNNPADGRDYLEFIPYGHPLDPEHKHRFPGFVMLEMMDRD